MHSVVKKSGCINNSVGTNQDSADMDKTLRAQQIALYVMQINESHSLLNHLMEPDFQHSLTDDPEGTISHTYPTLRIRNEQDIVLHAARRKSVGKESVNDIFEKKLHKCELQSCLSMIEDFPHLLVASTSKGKKFLNMVAKKGDVDLFRSFHELVPNWDERQSILERKDGYGYTPLMRAVENGNIDILSEILCVPDPVELIDMMMPEGGTILMAAARRYEKEIIEILLNSVQDSYHKQDLLLKSLPDGSTALSSAVTYGNVKIVDIILHTVRNPVDRQALIENLLKNHVTLLMRAAYQGYAKIILRLLSEVPDPLDFLFRQDKAGRTALDYAISAGQKTIVEIFLDVIEDPSCKKQLIEIARRDGTTNLMLAIQRGHRDIVNIFLATAGDEQDRADLIARTRIDGTNALMMAAKCGHTEIIEILLSAVEEPDHIEPLINMRKIDGTTVLMLAVQYADVACIQAVLGSVSAPGALIKMTDLGGNSARSLAILRNDAEIIALLDKMASNSL